MASQKKRFQQIFSHTLDKQRYYQCSWTVKEGTFSRLFHVFLSTYRRMRRSAKCKDVLQTLSVKIVPRVTPSIVTVTLTNGETKVIDVPLMKVAYVPSNVNVVWYRDGDFGLSTADIEALKEGTLKDSKYKYEKALTEGILLENLLPGCLEVFFRSPFQDDDSNVMDKQASIVVKWDGSASGNREGRKVLDFLSAWNAEPLNFSNMIGKLLGSCIYCSKQLSTASSLERGTGDRCAEKWGIAEGSHGLQLDDTAEGQDLAKNVRFDRTDNSTAMVEEIPNVDDEATITLVTSDGGRTVVSRQSDLIQRSGLMKDLLVDFEDTMNDTTEVPVAISSETLRMILIWTGDTRKVEKDGGIVVTERILDCQGETLKKVVDGLKALDYLCYEVPTGEKDLDFLLHSIVYFFSGKLQEPL